MSTPKEALFHLTAAQATLQQTIYSVACAAVASTNHRNLGNQAELINRALRDTLDQLSNLIRFAQKDHP